MPTRLKKGDIDLFFNIQEKRIYNIELNNNKIIKGKVIKFDVDIIFILCTINKYTKILKIRLNDIAIMKLNVI